MDHHLSWYHFLPGYDKLHAFFQENFSETVLFNSAILPEHGVIETVHHIFAAILVAFILLVSSFIVNKEIKDVEKSIVPNANITLANIFELIFDMLTSVMRDVIGKDYKKHVPFVGTLALFILCSNLVGLLPGFMPPTDNLNTTLACGLLVFIYFNYYGFKTQGIDHILHLANPVGYWWGWFLCPLLFPIEVIGVLFRPFSLSIRLAANMIGDHSVLMAFAGIMPLLIPLPFLFFGLLVSLIQTLVFCLLTCVYISMHTQDVH